MLIIQTARVSHDPFSHLPALEAFKLAIKSFGVLSRQSSQNLNAVVSRRFGLSKWRHLQHGHQVLGINKTCVCETRMPPAAKSQNMAKISMSYILTPPNPQGHGMSVKCEQPLDELTVQVWLLYHHSNFKYCTLFVSGTELQTDRWTDRQTDGRSNY